MQQQQQAELATASFVAAVTLLQQAVAADLEGATEVAMKLYSEAVARLDALANVLPSEQAAVVARHVASTRQRIDVLRDERGAGDSGALAAGFPQFPITFTPAPLPVPDEKDAPPLLATRRPFWLMRVLSASMQSGAYLTPSLYVSKAVWLQEGATAVVGMIPQKVRFLTVLCELLEPLQTLSNQDTKKFLASLDAFLGDAEANLRKFWSDIGRKMPTAGASTDGGASVPKETSRFQRGMRELLHKGRSALSAWKLQADASYSSYIAWAVNVLEQAQLFDRWVVYAAAGGAGQAEVMERLHRIAAHFYVGLCAALLQDVYLLVDRFVTKGRESLSRFLPGDVVVQSQQAPAAAAAAADAAAGSPQASK